MQRPTIEICVASALEATYAQDSGADRIELNCALQLGGLTPSAALTQRVLEAIRIPTIAMVRPRPGGFCYSKDDWDTLLVSAQTFVKQGVAGLAFGCLNPERRIDIDRVKQLRQLCPDTELVFHRAFDLVPNWKEALDQLMEIGVQRIMTSGQAESVPLGLNRIQEIVRHAGNQMEVIPAGGITAINVVHVLTETGCNQIHGTFSSSVIDPGYHEGPFRFAPNDDWRQSDPTLIKQVVDTLCQWAQQPRPSGSGQ